MIRLALVALAAALMLTGCGASSDESSAEISDADAAIVADIVRGAAGIVQTAAPLFVCDPSGGCDPATVEHLRLEADEVVSRLSPTVSELDAPCLRTAMRSWLGAIRGYAVYAKALGRGAEQASLDALDASDAAAWRGARRLEACGYAQRGQSIGLEASLAYQRVNRAVLGIESCQREPCFVREGKEIERAASIGIERMERVLKSVESSTCLRRVANTALDLLGTWEHYGRAATRLEGDVMERDIGRVTRLTATLGRQAQECIDEEEAGG